MQSLSVTKRTKALSLFPLISLIITGLLPAPAAAGESEAEPLEEFCLIPNGETRQACVAFFLDEGGYELCLMDEKEGIARCSRSWRVEPDENLPGGSFPAGPARLVANGVIDA